MKDFIPVPRALLAHRPFQLASADAKIMLLLLISHEYGKNNGRLHVTLAESSAQGISRPQHYRCIKELLRTGAIHHTWSIRITGRLVYQYGLPWLETAMQSQQNPERAAVKFRGTGGYRKKPVANTAKSVVQEPTGKGSPVVQGTTDSCTTATDQLYQRAPILDLGIDKRDIREEETGAATLEGPVENLFADMVPTGTSGDSSSVIVGTTRTPPLESVFESTSISLGSTGTRPTLRSSSDAADSSTLATLEEPNPTTRPKSGSVEALGGSGAVESVDQEESYFVNWDKACLPRRQVYPTHQSPIGSSFPRNVAPAYWNTLTDAEKRYYIQREGVYQSVN